MAGSARFRDPVRSVNHEFLAGLSLESTKIFPLPGGVGRRQQTGADPRLSGLKDLTMTGLDVVYYEHIATIRHARTKQFFVAFRETMDAFLARHSGQPEDMAKYPEWLMKQPNKQSERSIFVYLVTKNPHNLVLRSHEDWLSHIADPGTFDALVYFLATNDVIDQKAIAHIVR